MVFESNEVKTIRKLKKKKKTLWCFKNDGIHYTHCHCNWVCLLGQFKWKRNITKILKTNRIGFNEIQIEKQNKKLLTLTRKIRKTKKNGKNLKFSLIRNWLRLYRMQIWKKRPTHWKMECLILMFSRVKQKQKIIIIMKTETKNCVVDLYFFFNSTREYRKTFDTINKTKIEWNLKRKAKQNGISNINSQIWKEFSLIFFCFSLKRDINETMFKKNCESNKAKKSFLLKKHWKQHFKMKLSFFSIFVCIFIHSYKKKQKIKLNWMITWE